MKLYFYCFFCLSSLLISEIDFLDRIAIIVDEGIIMESEVNEALENTINNFKANNERIPPKEILFERVLERLFETKSQIFLSALNDSVLADILCEMDTNVFHVEHGEIMQ